MKFNKLKESDLLYFNRGIYEEYCVILQTNSDSVSIFSLKYHSKATAFAIYEVSKETWNNPHYTFYGLSKNKNKNVLIKIIFENQLKNLEDHI